MSKEKKNKSEIDRLIEIGQRIFLSAILAQGGFVIALVLTSIFFYSSKYTSSVDETVHNLMKIYRSDITQAAFIFETLDVKNDELPHISEFENALKANGVDSRVWVGACGGSGADRSLSLDIGVRKLDNCLNISVDRTKVLMPLLQLLGLMVVASVFMFIIWFVFRRQITSKFIEPLLESIKGTQKEAAIAQLARQVAHDIRSPLMAVRVAIVGLGDNESKNLIERAATRIDNIASELLSESRLANSESALDFSKAIIETVEEKKIEIESNSNIEIQNIVEENLRAASSVSETNIKNILSNILNNAVEACVGGGEIQVKARSLDSGEVELTVSDSGKGIPEDILTKIGRRGFSFGKTDGSGLGLSDAIAKVEKWNGELRIESEPDVGTTVRILLPCG